MTYGISGTVTTVTGGAKSFITNDWPALITMVLFILFVVLAWKIGGASLRKLGRMGRI